MRALENKVAIVTGGGRGIGKAISQRLAAGGARVIVNDTDEAPAQEVAKAVNGAACAGSVVDPAVAQAAVKLAVDSFGGLDILVNNAGITRDVTIANMSDADWDLVLDVCLRGTFNFTRAAAPAFKQRFKDSTPGNRKIVNIASVNGIYGVAANANYSAAKAGIIGLSKAAARELGRYRVNVNVVAPGYISGTRLTSPRDEEVRLGMDPALIAQVEKTIPIGRAGRPEDVAGVVAFLCSADSDYVTGQVIEVHGGREIIEVAG